MEGFKNSTRMTVMSDVAPQAYAKGGSVKAMAKVGKVMSEFGAGKLHSGSKKGPEVTNKKQAVAIALSEARKAGAKFPIKREGGGSSALTRAEREAMMEETSRPLTAAQQRAARAVLMAKAAAPKREPLLPTRVPSSKEMQRVFGADKASRLRAITGAAVTPEEMRMMETQDRIGNLARAGAYNKGGKVGGSKVPC
jgi:hypothetical protein